MTQKETLLSASELDRDRPNDALARLSRAARAEEVVVDWNSIDAKLFARVRERSVARRSAAMLLVAAAAAAFVTRSEAPSSVSLASIATPEFRAYEEPRHARVVAIDGELAVGGFAAQVGYDLASFEGSEIEMKRGHAIVTSEGLDLLLLEGVRARIRSTTSELQVRLLHGALEADVRAARDVNFELEGLAFVRATGRLRLERNAAQAALDLHHGEARLERIERGQTVDALELLAPARAEFEANGPIRLSNKPGRSPSLLLAASVPAPEPAAPKHTRGGERTATTPPEPEVAKVEPLAVAPEETLERAVRDCFQHAANPKTAAKISVSTTLTLHVADDGSAHSFVFAPPLSPETQSCVGQTVWKLRFPEPGTRVRHFELEGGQ